MHLKIVKLPPRTVVFYKLLKAFSQQPNKRAEKKITESSHPLSQIPQLVACYVPKYTTISSKP